MPEYLDYVNHENVDWVAEHVVRYWYVARELSPNDTVVDAACGAGYGTELLSWRARAITGIDQNAPLLEQATKRWPNIKFITADLNNTELPAADVLVTFETIEHLKDPNQYVSQFRKFKRVYLSTPHIPTKHHNEFHLHDFLSTTIKSWFKGWIIHWCREQHGMYTIICAEQKSASSFPFQIY